MSLTLRPGRVRRGLRARAACFAHKVWSGKGWISTLLLPLSWLVACWVWCKRWRAKHRAHVVYRSRVPVVVVGNILVGGTGKTPVVLAVIEALQARGWTPGLVSRGYGARASATPRCGAGRLDPALFGDEPSLVVAQTGVAVAVHRDRALALQVLQQHYPDVDVVIADDGLQHLALGRDIEIAVQDSRGCGNGRLLPAGPLREPAGHLRTVDFLITQQEAGKEAGGTPPPPAASRPDAPVVSDVRQTSAPRVVTSGMVLRPSLVTHLASGRSMPFDAWLAHYGSTPASAVAGIGVPQRFFRMLQAAGVQLGHTVSLTDHDDYRHPPFAQLPPQPILITPKDAVKCVALQDNRLWAVHPRADFSAPGWLDVLEGRLRYLRWQRREAGFTQ